jgi:hypothetical protein
MGISAFLADHAWLLRMGITGAGTRASSHPVQRRMELMDQRDGEFVCACASDDGKEFATGHFGDAEVYCLYRISDEGIEFIEKIENTSIEGRTHADAKKARSVKSLLQAEGVQVLVSRSFGPNIV